MDDRRHRPRGLRSPLRRAALWAIETYQRDVSPRLAARCSFHQSCSHYSHAAFTEHAAPVALAMTMGRLHRCHRRGRRRRSSRLLRVAAAIMVVAAATLLFPLLAQPASAATTVCSATLAGVDATAASTPGSAIAVDKGSSVTATGSMEGAPITYDVSLEFAGISWKVASGVGDGTTWSSPVNVDDYATHGVGIYKVQLRSVNAAGETCAATAFVNVSGGPLSSTAGKVAAGALAVGAVGCGAATVAAAKAPSKSIGEQSNKFLRTYLDCGSSSIAAVFMTAAAVLRSKGLL